MPDRRKIIYAVGAVALVMLVAFAWNWRAISAQADVGAAYGARIACSCRYVEGREMASCRDDKEPGMALVSLTDLAEEKAVKGSFPLIASRTARFRPGWGCLLDPMK